MSIRKRILSLKHKIFKPKSLYDQIGQKEGLNILINDFYAVMENDPKAKNCLEVHELHEGRIPNSVKEKLVMFLSGWLGGPNLFVEKFGHPRMRMRHIHVKIREIEGEEWLYCMYQALERHPNKLSKSFKDSFFNSCKALVMRIINT